MSHVACPWVSCGQADRAWGVWLKARRWTLTATALQQVHGPDVREACRLHGTPVRPRTLTAARTQRDSCCWLLPPLKRSSSSTMAPQSYLWRMQRPTA